MSLFSWGVSTEQFLAEECGTDGGILDWTCDTAGSVEAVIKVVAVTVAIIFVVYKAVQSKFAIGTIIVSALAAGVFIWIVFNVTDLQNTVDEDLPGTEEEGAPPLIDVSDPLNEAVML